MMRRILANTAAWGLGLLLVVPSAAQTGDSSAQGGRDQGKDKQQQKGEGSQGQTRTIRGEIASVSIIGETMVDYETGRAIAAEFSYLTILGSPTDGSMRGSGGEGSDQKDGSGNQGGGAAQAADSKGQGSGGDQSKKDQGSKGAQGQSSEGRGRRVYLIAVGPETQCHAGGGKGTGDQQGSARERSQAAFSQMHLGDRVEVEFAPLRPQGQGQGQAGGQDRAKSENQTRHGRNRIVRGVAKSITLISHADHDGESDNSGGQHGGQSSSGGDRGGSKPDREKGSGQDR